MKTLLEELRDAAEAVDGWSPLMKALRDMNIRAGEYFACIDAELAKPRDVSK